ncbi:hypothetical protein MGYG_05051 [Paecilomyces variotii No. 5]|uniref:MEI5 protein n=1 Tax=Byssochlamys spectabilis (strain No. 5 / NBRC 109023) TaxID=1356009 RepID=V5FF10_BYSSN|nr:hypothetical protein MGYG_05051 [Paecilomyces variotii No. 5]
MSINQHNSTRARGSDYGLQRTREAAEHLASLYEYIHRVATFANLFRENRDLLDVIEGNESIRKGLSRERYIQSLKEDLGGMERLKNIELERKDHEIKELQNKIKHLTSEKASLEETKKKMEEDRIKADRKRMEDRLSWFADRKKEREQHEREMKEQKTKLEEKARKELAAKEDEFQKKESRLQEEKAAVIAENEQVKAELADAREEIRKETKFHELLLKDNRRLDAELEVAQSRCPIQREEPGVFKEELDKLSQRIRIVTTDYFTHLPAGDLAKYYKISKKLVKLHDIFGLEMVPNLPTPASTFLRIRIAQFFIMECLKREVWRPFRSSVLEKQNADPSPVLQALSTKYRDLSQEEEISWRVWTYRGLDTIAAAVSSEAGDTSIETSVNSVAAILSPLMRENIKGRFKEDLTDILEGAASLWTRIRTDNSHISIDFTPPLSLKTGQTCDGWDAEAYDSIDMHGDAIASSSKDVITDTWEPWCLFPRIESRSINDELHILHRGCALYPDSPAFAKGRLEQDEMLRNASAVPLSPISMASA